MIQEDRYFNEITAAQVAETNLGGVRPLRDLIFDTTQLVLQRDFVLLRDFGYYYETLPL
jgi:hypothetical protein